MAPRIQVVQRGCRWKRSHQIAPISAASRPVTMGGSNEPESPDRPAAASFVWVESPVGGGSGGLGLSSDACTTRRCEAEYLGLHVVRVTVAGRLGSGFSTDTSLGSTITWL